MRHDYTEIGHRAVTRYRLRFDPQAKRAFLTSVYAQVAVIGVAAALVLELVL